MGAFSSLLKLRMLLTRYTVADENTDARELLPHSELLQEAFPVM